MAEPFILGTSPSVMGDSSMAPGGGLVGEVRGEEEWRGIGGCEMGNWGWEMGDGRWRKVEGKTTMVLE